MTSSANWIPYFRNGMMTAMLGMSLYCIYSDGFIRYTWLPHTSLALMLWAVLSPDGTFQTSINPRSLRFWAFVLAALGMIVDVFLITR
jgi:hypothetical protein